MKPGLEALFATLKALSYPEQMKVSQAFTDIVDPWDTYYDVSEMGGFDPISNPNEDVVGGLMNTFNNDYANGDEDTFEEILRDAINRRGSYGSF